MKILGLVLLCFVSVNSISDGAIIGRNVANDGYLTQGEYEYGDVKVTENSVLSVMGGGAFGIIAKDNSYIEITSTSLPLSGDIDGGGVWSIMMWDNSTLNFSGGATNVIYMVDDSTALLTGGQINYIASYQDTSFGTHVTLDCQKNWSWIYEKGVIEGITGKWLNGTAFTIGFINNADADPVYENVNVIPEPATLALFGLGGLFVKKRRS